MEVSVVICRYRKRSIFVLVKPTRLHKIRRHSTSKIHSKNPQNKLCSSCVLCVGVELIFPLAKPSRSFQNLTETLQGKRVLLSPFCFPKVVKMATKIEYRFNILNFYYQNDTDYKFFHCENVSKGCNHFHGGKVSVVFFYLFKMLQHHANISV